MVLRGRRPRATFLGREAVLLVGPMRVVISGSLLGLVSTQLGSPVTLPCGSSLTTCGSTAQANGRGRADQTWSLTPAHTGLRGRLRPAIFLGREAVLLV